MSRTTYFLQLYFLFAILFSLAACKEADPCETIICLNDGICDGSGNCDCPLGYMGDDCSQMDFTEIQALLDNGIPPKVLYENGVSPEDMYGKTYAEGLIFYLDITDGTGMVAAPASREVVGNWGCYGLDIAGLSNVYFPTADIDGEVGGRIGDGISNTDSILANCFIGDIAADLCRDQGADWYLPSVAELNLMYVHLDQNGYGDFKDVRYWSSTEFDGGTAWVQKFYDNGGRQGNGKSNYNFVRPVRNF